MTESLLDEKDILSDSMEWSFPNCPGIYFLIRENKIVYVGQSKSVVARLLSHYKYKNFDRFYYCKVNESELNDYETYYILKFAPEENKTIPNNSYFKTIDQISKYFSVPVGIVDTVLREKSTRKFCFLGIYYYLVTEIYNDLVQAYLAQERK